MRFVLLLALGFGTVLLFPRNAAAQMENIDEIGKTPVEAKFLSDGRIRLSLCPGAVHLIGRDDSVLRISYHSHSGGDEDVRVRIQVSGEQAGIRVSGCPRNNFELKVEMPKSSNLYVRMFAGELIVNGVTGDKDVELHAGHLTMELGKPEDYARVDASVLTGDLEASAFDVSKGGLFRSFDRSGPGKYRVHAHVGAGQIELR
jgi:hypothetical protein